jgi:hypothetical protein
VNAEEVAFPACARKQGREQVVVGCGGNARIRDGRSLRQYGLELAIGRHDAVDRRLAQIFIVASSVSRRCTPAGMGQMSQTH